MIKQNEMEFYDLENENDYLSNWYASPFELDGIQFCCMEQYMMYRKAEMFRDEDAMAAILASEDPKEMKLLGRTVKNFYIRMWDGRSQLVLFTGLMAKFTQNEELREKLLSTGDAILVECSPTEEKWGIAVALTDERRLNPDFWTGMNLLGYTLMEVREQLKK